MEDVGRSFVLIKCVEATLFETADLWLVIRVGLLPPYDPFPAVFPCARREKAGIQEIFRRVPGGR